MTKQNANLTAIAALILAVIALALQLFFASTGHSTRALVAEVAWPVLLVICIGVFVWGRTLKS